LNAKGRARKGKIMTEEKYKGKSPGRLDIRIRYDSGCLYVTLGQASLYGKPSQDPYALVYIHDPHTGLCKFQIGNNKTRTFDKNINPNFNSEFQLLVNYEELVLKSQSLVVAVWDQDTTSRDDYMAGCRVQLPPDGPPLTGSTGWRTISLKHQDRDGHPAPSPPSEIFTVSGPAPSPQGTTSSYPPQSATGGYGALGSGYPTSSSGAPASGYPPQSPSGGHGALGSGYPTSGYGARASGYPTSGSGAPGSGYPTRGYGAPSSGYPPQSPTGGHGAPASGYPTSGSGAPTSKYPTTGSGAPASGYPGSK